ncbi:MAG: hypothetical protein GY761_21765, partial [Hyphomicrobiales bacterium]|nr:hypothetical protein [Hyphomicrobiales bacterium]
MKSAQGGAEFQPDLDVADDPIRIDIPPVSPAPTPINRRQNYKCGGVGLALGGGAARGWAHIGVIRAFVEAGIDISMIAGTSIGALVGGCYLSGHLDELEEFARSITRTNMLRYMDFTLRGSGLISGERLANRMDEHIGDINIENLNKPFVAISADIKTGNEIWLHDGPLTRAIRCSYALPGVFQPVENGGKLLVDGAIVNPVPVSACRAYEPDVVIAVNLNSETFGKGTVIRASSNEASGNNLFDFADNSAQPESKSEAEDMKSSSWLSRLSSDKSKRESRSKNLGVTGVMMEAFNIIQ